MYDVLDKVVIDSALGKTRDDKVDWAIGHLAHAKEDDLLASDRHDCSYFFLSSLRLHPKKFVICGSNTSFKTAREMFKREGRSDQIVTLAQPIAKQEKMRIYNLPKDLNF